MATEVNELLQLRMELEATREQLNRTLDALADKITRMLPATDETRHKRFKNFSRKDWSNYLDL